MPGNNTYKEFARWREHWMSIMFPQYASVPLPTIRPDKRTPLAVREGRVLQPPTAIAQASCEGTGKRGNASLNKLSSGLEQPGIETYIWED